MDAYISSMEGNGAPGRFRTRRRDGPFEEGIAIVRLVQALLLCLALEASGAAGDGGFLIPTAMTVYSWPLRLGGRVGLNWMEPVEGTRLLYSGKSVSLEAARDGMRLGFGGKYQAIEFLPLMGAGLAVSGMYVWSGEDAAYLGLEANLSVLIVSLCAGAYRRVSGDAHDELILSVGVGGGLP